MTTQELIPFEKNCCGFVYIIGSNIGDIEPFHACVKIGYATDLAGRCNQIRKSNCREGILFASLQTSDAGGFEAMLHNILDKFHYRGEWFILPLEIINELRSIQAMAMIGTPDCRLQTDHSLTHAVQPLEMAVKILNANKKSTMFTSLKRSNVIPTWNSMLAKFCRGHILQHYRAQMIYHDDHHKYPIYLIASLENPLLIFIDDNGRASSDKLDRIQTGNPEHLFYYGTLCGNGDLFYKLKSKLFKFAILNHPSWYCLNPSMLMDILIYCTPKHHNRPNMKQQMTIFVSLIDHKLHNPVSPNVFDDVFRNHLKCSFWSLLETHLRVFNIWASLFPDEIVDILLKFVGDEAFTQEPLPDLFACAMCRPTDRANDIRNHENLKRWREQQDKNDEHWSYFDKRIRWHF